ncbi:MAG: DUF6427 family protein [Flavobacteriales bacterium AspAUS03]
MISRLLDLENVFLLFIFYTLIGCSWYFLYLSWYEDKGFILSAGLLIFTLAFFGILRRFLSKGQYPAFFLSFWMLTFHKSFINLSVSIALIWILCAFILFPIGKDQSTVKTRLFYSSFSVGLASLFFPPALLYLIWLVPALLFKRESEVKNWLICILGLLTPIWTYLLGLSLLDRLDMGVVDRYLSFLNISSLPLDVQFYLFFGVSVFCFGGLIKGIVLSKRQKIASKKAFKHYLLTVFPGFLILLFYSSESGQYAFLMVPLCLILSNLLTYMKNRPLKEVISWAFMTISIFFLVLESYR